MRNIIFTIVFTAICSVSTFAYDFSAVCSTGQTLYYDITSAVEPYTVEVVPDWPNHTTGDLEIPESVEYNSITYSVTSIGNSAFSECSGLTSVTIPNSVTRIVNGAFWHCSGLTSVTIPNSVTSIGVGAFNGCSGLTSFSIPNSVTEIDNETFYYCTGLTSVTIPNSVTRIGERAFCGCSGLTTITIGEGVTTISLSVFRGCSSLTTVNFNATNCTYCGRSYGNDFAFGNCSSFTLNIGENVTIIPEDAFNSCTLTSIVSRATNPPAIYSSSFDSSLSPMTPLTVPCGTTADYQRYWYYFRNIQEDCSGIEETGIADMQIYPNPATDVLNITSSETISEIEIVNTLGQVVKRIEVNSDNAVCDVENLPNGFYVVRIYNEDTKSFCQKKFAKE